MRIWSCASLSREYSVTRARGVIYALEEGVPLRGLRLVQETPPSPPDDACRNSRRHIPRRTATNAIKDGRQPSLPINEDEIFVSLAVVLAGDATPRVEQRGGFARRLNLRLRG